MARKIVAVVLIVAVLSTGYLFIRGSGDTVAIVNGQRISRDALAARANDTLEQYAAYGTEITAELMSGINRNALDELIAEALLAQGAKAAGVVIGEEDVEAYYQQLVAEYGTEEYFLSLLAENGYTVSSFRAEIASHLAIQRYVEMYIEENVDPGALAVTQAEMQELYEFYAAQMEDIPPFEEVKDYLEEELRAWKLEELQIMDQIINKLKDEADIKVTL